MFYIEDDVMYLTRGDDAQLDVQISGDDGSAYALQSGDRLVLTIKQRAAGDSPALIEIDADEGAFTIQHAHTASLAPGKYSADIQLRTADGGRHTVWPMLSGSKRAREHNFENFVIMPEVTIL